MPDKQPTPAEAERSEDAGVLDLLVNDESHRPWAYEEIERELARDVSDSLARLYGAGLIHRLDRFVWATRAALVAEAIAV